MQSEAPRREPCTAAREMTAEISSLTRANRRLSLVSDASEGGMQRPERPGEQGSSFMSELVISLDNDKIRMLRKEFERRGPDGVTLPQFCHVRSNRGRVETRSHAGNEIVSIR